MNFSGHGGSYQELPEINTKHSVGRDSESTEGVAALDGNCHIFDDPHGSTAVIILPVANPEIVYKFISNMENFVYLSPDIQCATPKSNNSRRIIGQSSQTSYLELTFVRKSCFFWTVYENADATFQIQEKENPMSVILSSRNQRGEKMTSTYFIENHVSGTRVINKVEVSDEKKISGVSLCCWNEKYMNIKLNQKSFLHSLRDAVQASVTAVILYDDEYIV